jgi:hypothetical protein
MNSFGWAEVEWIAGEAALAWQTWGNPKVEQRKVEEY